MIFFAVADSFVQAEISGRQGLKMLLICLVNVAVAFAIGLLLLPFGVETRGKALPA